MDANTTSQNGNVLTEEEQNMSDTTELRRGTWTVEEDFALINYVAHHGEGRWNSLARSAGLKRTGKSCRLRWLNYLRPDVRRGEITLQEQLLILQLHSRWGNKWSKIAQHLPGRTDNEIKNYWRTRVQKHAKQLKCDVNSKQFKDTMRYLWIPRLAERIQAATAVTTTTTLPMPDVGGNQVNNNNNMGTDCSSTGSEFSDLPDCQTYSANQGPNHDESQADQFGLSESLISPCGLQFQWTDEYNSWMIDDQVGDVSDNSWNVDDIWFLQQQFNLN